MCAMCGSYPCVSRCPNAPDPEPVHTCSWCNEPIFEEDKYMDTADGPVCKGCIEGMTVSEFMEMIGETFSTAKKEE